ncbi:beta-ketoacyl-ACP reductase [Hypericibacter terrae]|jgi:acetoacetyl-CoA reductase|uniref:Beta-ketoacyl-ACP reductase n=1 Tax=Hypericibacter terrae TaxID=2602015 RepID=A0A5J6MPP7_9PROT|nr:acetoacetyl-CoA reductase [Hypericibacter terrae]QEX19363.1 beta-ketoacyl-ACP reductase [Hypericibacter terrae]
MTRLALVTGGTRGIGRAIAEALKKAHYRVVANYSGNDAAAREFTAETGIPAMKFDVGDFAACEAAIKKITAEHGPIEILVNNAGITRDTTLHKMTPQIWDEVLRTNITSCFNLSRLVIESMRERGFGRIINIGSINGQSGQFGQSNYAAAKAAMHGFSKALALESAAKGITVNTICPGYINTDMVRAVPEPVLAKIVAKIPVGRLGEPEEIARCVTFLAADEAGFITGSQLTINGGQYML